MASPADTALPASIVSNVITGELTDAGTTYYIKIFRSKFKFSTALGKITGDGDSSPNWIPDGWVECSFSFRGAVVASQDIGVVNLGQGSIAATKFYLASGQTITLTQAVIADIDIEYDRNAPFIGLAMSGRATQTARAAFEA